MHSSLPPSSPPVSTRSSATLGTPPVTPSQHSLRPSLQSFSSSSLPPPYSAAGLSKAGMRLPKAVTRSPELPSHRASRSSATRPASSPGGTWLSGVQLDGQDVHFNLIDHKLYWKKVPRMSRCEFEAKLGTDTPAAKHWRKTVYSKDWLLAQLFHYDLFSTYNPYGLDARSTEMVLKQMLSMAAANGMCDHVPQRILLIEAQLRERADRDFANQLVQRQLLEAAQRSATPQTTKASASHARGYEEEEYDGEIADPWAELHETPGAQANLDADRFFNHYFLRDGKPDRKKTRRGLRLDGLAEGSDAVVQRAERYGLYRCVTKETPKRVCLGWDLEMVQQMAEHTDTKIRARRLQARTREETRLKEAHDELVAQCQREKGRRGGWDIAGQYLILANELTDRCSPESPLTLGISDKLKVSDVGPGRGAGFDFCLASGSMLLATSSPIMDWLLADAEKDHRASVAGDEGLHASRKRKLPPTEAQLLHRQKRDFQTSRPNKKKAMHYELRIRGHEVVADGEKRIFHQPRSGHIWFRDAMFTAFSGKINMGEVLGVVDIQGFKYALDAPRKTPKWNDFTEAAASLEREAGAGNETRATQCKKAKTPRRGKPSTPKGTAKLRRSYLKQKKD